MAYSFLFPWPVLSDMGWSWFILAYTCTYWWCVSMIGGMLLKYFMGCHAGIILHQLKCSKKKIKLSEKTGVLHFTPIQELCLAITIYVYMDQYVSKYGTYYEGLRLLWFKMKALFICKNIGSELKHVIPEDFWIFSSIALRNFARCTDIIFCSHVKLYFFNSVFTEYHKIYSLLYFHFGTVDISVIWGSLRLNFLTLELKF